MAIKKNVTFQQLYLDERSKDLKKISLLILRTYAIPLFLSFSLLDYFFYPEYFSEFFLVRITSCSLIFGLFKLLNRTYELQKIELIIFLIIQCFSAAIYYLIFRADSTNSPYYWALIELILVVSTGLRLSWTLFILNSLLIVLPYFSIIYIFYPQSINTELTVVFLTSACFLLIIYFNKWIVEKVFIENIESRIEKMRFEEKLGSISLQLIHDLKPAVEAMKIVTSTVGDKSVEKIGEQAISRIENMIDEVSSEKRKERESSYCINDLILSIGEEFKIRLKNYPKVDFSLIVSKEKVFYKVNRTEFERAVFNILQNSLEALKGEGSISLGLEAKEKFQFLIFIKDNGPGIEESQLKLIFEKGFTSGKQKGTGLGLYQAKIFAEKSNLEILVEKNYPTGIVFYLKN